MAQTISSISTPRSGSPLVAVSLESGERLLVSPARVIGLGAGDELDAGALESLRRGALSDRLEGRLLRLLSTRWRSRAELARRLSAWGASEGEAEQLLTRLESQGFLDDRRLAADVSRHVRRRGQGSVRVAYDMARLAVADEAAAEAVGEHARDDPSVAAELVARRFGEAPYDAATCRRAAALLVRSGFDEDTITRVLDLDRFT